MRNITIILLVGILLISLGGASQEKLGTFKQNDCIQLKQSCADCTYVNFTKVSYPNSSQALGEVEAEQNGISFNYTFCNTTENGLYIVEGFGDVGGDKTVFIYDFEITKTGLDFDTKESIVSIGLIFGLIAVSVFFIIFSRTTESPGVKLFFNLLSYLMMFLSIGAGYVMLQSIQSNMEGISDVALYTMAIVFIIIMFYIMINVTKQTLGLMRKKKGFGDSLDDTQTF